MSDLGFDCDLGGTPGRVRDRAAGWRLRDEARRRCRGDLLSVQELTGIEGDPVVTFASELEEVSTLLTANMDHVERIPAALIEKGFLAGDELRSVLEIVV